MHETQSFSLRAALRRCLTENRRAGKRQSAAAPIRQGELSPAAKYRQAKPNPSKLIQIKLLGFAWSYSSESGLFNGLWRIQIKNFLSFLPAAKTGKAGGLKSATG
jgi:hypothetical protein